jgi:hypothetical protein
MKAKESKGTDSQRHKPGNRHLDSGEHAVE